LEQGWACSSVVEHLFTVCEALGSFSSMEKTKQNSGNNGSPYTPS
jgi:hypothetical protein